MRKSRKVADKDGLTPEEQMFCYEYLANSFNATAALKAAGYSHKEADSSASRVLKRPNVRARIQKLVDKYTDTIAWKSEDVVKEIALIASSDIADFVEWDEKGTRIKASEDLWWKTRCVKKIEIKETITEEGAKDRTIKIELHDKMKALDLLAKKWKIINGDNNITPNVNINIDGKDVQGKSAAEITRDYSAILGCPVKSE